MLDTWIDLAGGNRRVVALLVLVVFAGGLVTAGVIGGDDQPDETVRVTGNDAAVATTTEPTPQTPPADDETPSTTPDPVATTTEASTTPPIVNDVGGKAAGTTAGAGRGDVNVSVGSASDVGVQIGELMPGDSGSMVLEVNNSGDVAGDVSILSEIVGHENGINEPEAEAGDDSPDEGELQDYLRATVYVGGDVVVDDRPVGELPIVSVGVLAPGESASVRVVFRLPLATGNDAQTDWAEMTLTVHMEPAS